MPPSRNRLAATYAASFGVIGSVAPYLAFELRARGVTGLGLMGALAAWPLGRLVGGPVWGMVADRFRNARQIMAVSAGIAALGGVLLAAVPSAALAGVLLIALGRAPVDTLLEGVTLHALGDDPLAYGRVRLWGSVSFLVAALGSGELLAAGGPSPLILGAVMGGVTLLLVLGLPVERYEPTPIGPALRALATNPAVPWFLLGAALHFLSHIGATAFLAVHVSSLGLSQSWTGIALASGVAVEVAIMAAAPWLLARFSPASVCLFAVGLAIPRWALNASVDDPLGVVAIQTLHGITFGAWWVAAVARMGKWAAPEIRTSAQGLLGAASAGVGNLMGMVGVGWLVDHGGTARMFWVMAGISVLALAATAMGQERRARG